MINFSRCKCCGIALAVVALSYLADTASAFERERFGAYVFERIAVTGNEIQHLNTPVLSNRGEIAFRAFHQDESSAIYYVDGSDLQQLVASGHPHEGGRFDL